MQILVFLLSGFPRHMASAIALCPSKPRKAAVGAVGLAVPTSSNGCFEGSTSGPNGRGSRGNAYESAAREVDGRCKRGAVGR